MLRSLFFFRLLRVAPAPVLLPRKDDEDNSARRLLLRVIPCSFSCRVRGLLEEEDDDAADEPSRLLRSDITLIQNLANYTNLAT